MVLCRRCSRLTYQKVPKSRKSESRTSDSPERERKKAMRMDGESSVVTKSTYRDDDIVVVDAVDDDAM